MLSDCVGVYTLWLIESFLGFLFVLLHLLDRDNLSMSLVITYVGV